MAGDQSRMPHHGGYFQERPARLCSIAPAPMLARDPVSQFAIVSLAVDTDAPHQRGIARAGNEKARKHGLTHAFDEAARIRRLIGPWRAGKVPHDAMVGDTGVHHLPVDRKSTSLNSSN